MYSDENPIKLDEDSVFFDNREIVYQHVNKKNFIKSSQSNIDHFYDSDFNKILKKYNYFSNNCFNISLFVGLESKYTKNNICNSEIYFQDLNYLEKRTKYFNDSENYKGNKLEVQNNTLILKKTYGIDNPDELFEKVAEAPFEEIENIENITTFFEMPSELKYPRYFNYYSLSRLNSNISIFGTIEEIDGGILTERSLLGLKCEVISSGTDARGRTINFSNSITLQESEKDENGKQKSSIESYSDEEYADLVTGNDTLLKRSFAYTNKIINGQVVTVFDTSQNTSSLIPRLTNKIIYYSEDNNNILPFNDRSIVENSNNQMSLNEYNKGDIYPSHGYDSDNTYGAGPDSKAYIGDID